MRNSATTILYWTNCYSGTQACTCSLVSYIEGWTLRNPECGSAINHVFFSNETAYICVEISVSVDRFGSGILMMSAAISYNRRTNLVHVQGNLATQRYRENMLQLQLLNVIDRQGDASAKQCPAPYSKGKG
jgi:hypothetical protein